MDKQIKKIKKVGARLRKTGEICLFSSKGDREQIMKFCNILADKIDEIIEVLNKREKENDT